MRSPVVSRARHETTIRVLQLFASAPDQDRYGYDVAVELGVPAGLAQAALSELEAAGLLESYELDIPLLRPRRHYLLAAPLRATP